MKKLIFIIVYILVHSISFGQSYNHQWLLGNYNFLQDPKGRMFIDSNNYNIVTEFRKMPFYGTQGNICDANGDLLMSSNGVWIANSNNDTMMNGGGINPGSYVNNWPFGLVIPHANVFLPYPGDSSKYILFHHSAEQFTGNFIPALELYLSIIDITQNSGLGNVTSKNNIAIQDTLGWGIGACRHANGRDWWVVMLEDSSDIIYTLLYNSSGTFNVTTQSLNYLPLPHANSVQPTFSPEGNKFISTTYDNVFNQNGFLIIADFDRCSGIFSNIHTLQLTSGAYLWGLAFSPSGKYAYACSQNYIFQVDMEMLTVDTVATYDGFISPGPSCCPTTFFNMYLAANGKIYVTSGSSIRHFTEINYPDSAGATACDVDQHSVFIGSYAHLSAVPNHPNYYLGCDTTGGCPCSVGIEETGKHSFKFLISPNPSNGFIKITYLLPQNKPGTFEVFDINGRKVYSMRLPQWSTLQQISLPNVSDGIYNCVMTSGNDRISKKLAVIKE